MLNKICDIEGWTTINELRWLYDTSSTMNNAIIVETGAWKGRSTAALCCGALKGANNRVFTIDTFAGAESEKEYYKEVNGDNIYWQFTANMQMLNIDPVVLRMDSVKAACCFANNSIDFLFIDCDHYNISNVFWAYIKKVKGTGIISGHDYGLKPIHDFIAENNLEVETPAGGIWWLKR